MRRLTENENHDDVDGTKGRRECIIGVYKIKRRHYGRGNRCYNYRIYTSTTPGLYGRAPYYLPAITHYGVHSYTT